MTQRLCYDCENAPAAKVAGRDGEHRCTACAAKRKAALKGEKRREQRVALPAKTSGSAAHTDWEPQPVDDLAVREFVPSDLTHAYEHVVSAPARDSLDSFFLRQSFRIRRL
jgi:hypothetical protein